MVVPWENTHHYVQMNNFKICKTITLCRFNTPAFFFENARHAKPVLHVFLILK